MKTYILLAIILFLFITCKNSSSSKSPNASKKIERNDIRYSDETKSDIILKSEEKLQKEGSNFIIPREISTPKKLEDLLSLKILKTETIDFNGDGKLDFLCKVEKDISNGKMIEEYWISFDEKVLRRKELSLEYDYKWFINLT